MQRSERDIQHNTRQRLTAKPFDVHCCHMGGWCHTAERQSAPMSKITNDGLTQSGTERFIAVHIWQQWASKG